MSTIPIDTVAKLSDLRARVLRNESIPPAELSDALRKYREFRGVKAVAATQKRETAAVTKAGAELPAAFLDLFNNPVEPNK